MDWRQTKHLSLIVPALTLLIGRLFVIAGDGAGAGQGIGTGLGARVRPALRLLLLASLAWNVWWIVRLSMDFSTLVISTEW